MDKAILVMDMPETCSDCDLCYDCMDCAVREGTNVTFDFQTFTEDRMEWCKLRLLKKIAAKVEAKHPYKVPGDFDTYSQYNEGWVDAVYAMCVEITEGGEDE